jgi:mRNA interferase RelE/StbE
MNKVNWTLKALKQLRKLPRKQQVTIVEKVGGLAGMPDCVNVKSLTGCQGQYRLRVGRYRVIFSWQREIKIVTIEKVGKRDERTY